MEERISGRVSEKKRASGEWSPEERQIRKFLPSVVRDIPTMIFIKRASDLSFVLLNRFGEELLGVKEVDVLGKSDYDFFPRDEAEFFTKSDREVLETGVLRDINEEPITTPNGVRWLHTKKIPLYDENGLVAGIFGRRTTQYIRRNGRRHVLWLATQDAINKLSFPIQIEALQHEH